MAKLSKKQQIKKKFFQVEIPILRKTIELYGQTISDFNNQTIKLNLASELHGKALDTKFKITIENEKATASPTELKLLSSYLKRTTRKGTDYTETSLITEGKEQKIKIKTIAVTRKRVTRKVLASLSKLTKQELEDYLKQKDFETVFNEILSSKLQKQLMTTLKKIYPLNAFEVKYFGIYEKEEYDESKEALKEEQEKETKKLEEKQALEEQKEEKTEW